MNKKFFNLSSFFVVFFAVFFVFSNVYAQDKLKFSCSAQIAEALGKDVIQILKEKKGIVFDLKIVSSDTALNRLENGFSEIAAVTLPISYDMVEKGYVAIPFCKDPIVVIGNKSVSADSLKTEEVNSIFSGSISNWKEVGGEDLSITKIIPCQETGAYKNFERLFMGLKSLKYDFMTYCSVTTIKGVESINGAVSFISHGAAVKSDNIKIFDINGKSPMSEDYKHFQTFTFVTKGRPSQAAKELIDVALSARGQEIMKEKGMIPILPTQK
jgi:phosphate transport system substrate-binding protein